MLRVTPVLVSQSSPRKERPSRTLSVKGREDSGGVRMVCRGKEVEFPVVATRPGRVFRCETRGDDGGEGDNSWNYYYNRGGPIRSE